MHQTALLRRSAIRSGPTGTIRHLTWRAGVLAIISLLLVSGLASPVEAAQPVRFGDTIPFSGLDEEATDECGFDINADGQFSFTVQIRENKDGEVFVIDRVSFHATYTNVETGETVKSNGTSTAHVAVGAGTDGRDVVKITGLQGHIVAPGSGSAAQDSGQLVIEAFGPDDPDPLFVHARGLFEGMGGPFPELCDALS